MVIVCTGVLRLIPLWGIHDDWLRLVIVSTLGAVVYLAIFGTIVAYTAFRHAMHHLAAGKVMLYAYVNPAVAVLVGGIVLSEPVTLRMIVAMVVILAGVAIAQSDRTRK